VALFKKHLNAIKVKHSKNTAESQAVKMPLPKTLKIPMLMHIGTPCDVCVKVGDKVQRGQVIGNSEAFLSVPIHSPVAATVVKIDDYTTPAGVMTKAVILDVDEEQPETSFTPPVVESHEQLVQAAKNCGLVGLGGAAFPTFVKLNPKNIDEVNTLIVNAAECEPFITSDNRTMLEWRDNVVLAMDKIVKFMNLQNVIIGIEENKPKAIKAFSELAKQIEYLSVKVLKSRYPQGAEKVLVFETTGKVIGEGKLPSDVGVVVLNVTTLQKFGEYLTTGAPLMEKCVTVDGGAIANPANVIVPIGTEIADLVDFTGGYKCEPKKVLYGGPMMGLAIKSDKMPIIKNTNAILVFGEKEAKRDKITPCIRCGRCHFTCPFGLLPAAFEKNYYANDVAALENLNVLSCMECGCCAYICPASRDLVATNRLAKNLVRKKLQEGKK
jgi:electron transport complex protein RnfC